MIPRQPMSNGFTGTPEEVEEFNETRFSLEYMTTITFRDQIGTLCNYLRKVKILFSYERIGKLFNESKHYIWDQHKNYLRGDRNDGRPCSLTIFQLKDIYQSICSCHRSNNPIYPTYNDISYYISQKYNKYIPGDTLRHIFRSEFSDFFKIIESDADRIEVSLIDILSLHFSVLYNMNHSTKLFASVSGQIVLRHRILNNSKVNIIKLMISILSSKQNYYMNCMF